MLLVTQEKHMYAQILSEKNRYAVCTCIYISEPRKGGGDVGGKCWSKTEKEKKGFFFSLSLTLGLRGEKIRDVTYAAVILLLLACGCPSFATKRIGLVNGCITCEGWVATAIATAVAAIDCSDVVDDSGGGSC